MSAASSNLLLFRVPGNEKTLFMVEIKQPVEPEMDLGWLLNSKGLLFSFALIIALAWQYYRRNSSEAESKDQYQDEIAKLKEKFGGSLPEGLGAAMGGLGAKAGAGAGKDQTSHLENMYEKISQLESKTSQVTNMMKGSALKKSPSTTPTAKQVGPKKKV